MKANTARSLCGQILRAHFLQRQFLFAIKSLLCTENPWAHYKFDISNEISKRLDTLLGGNNTSANTNANNANLLKYTLCILAVLDWWVNNPDSPAYTTNPRRIFRISEEDGKPKFSVPERNDQNRLFAEQIRAALTKKS